MPKKAVKKTVKKKTESVLRHLTKNDPAREQRIEDYLVDTYGDPEEQAVGWYYSLHDALVDKIRCHCFKKRSMSPLAPGEEVDIVGMPPEDDCMREMFVYVRWNNRKIAVPLNQLEPLDGDDTAIQVIEDWLYWCMMGYEF